MTDIPTASTGPAPAPAGLLCPVCRVDLLMSERQGIEIDYCPKCRGVWLDRGELDKIIERAAATEDQGAASPPLQPGAMPQPSSPWTAPVPPQAAPYPAYGGGYPGEDGHGHHGGNRHHGRQHGFLSRLFD